MNDDEIRFVLRDEAAQVIRRLTEQDGRSPTTTAAEAIAVYAMVREELWAGGEFFSSRDGGITHAKITFSFQPPRLPARPDFFSWLGMSAYFPLLAGIIITTCSSIITAVMVGNDAFGFASRTILISYALCGLLGGAGWLLTRKKTKRQ